MDPILIKAVRDMLTAQARAKGSISPADIEAFLREETGGKYGLADAEKIISQVNTDVNPTNIAKSAAQGAMFNFGDEARGLVHGEGDKEMTRLRDEMFRREHPWVDAGSAIAGSALSAAAGGTVIGGAARALGVGIAPAQGLAAVGRGAALGAGAGTAAGIGAGEGLDDRVTKGLQGLALGGIAGTVIPAVASTVSRMRDPLQRAMARIDRAIDQSGGIAALRAKLGEIVAAGRGKEVVLGDLSPQMRQVTDFAVNNSDEAYIPLEGILNPRRANAPNRMLDDVSELLGEEPDAALRAGQLADETSRFGKEGYDALRAGNPNVDIAAIKPILEQPIVKGALAEAQKTGRIGAIPDEGQPSFQMLQDVKESLDDAASKAFRAGEGNLGKRLAEARDAIVGHLEVSVPDYAKVSAGYAERKGREKALELGKEWWARDDTRGLKRVLGDLAPEDKVEFQRGMASELVDKLRNTSTNRAVANQFTDASEAMQDKLQLVFGSKETFDEFMKRAAVERDFTRLNGVLGGSATARRQAAAGFDPAEVGAALPTAGLAGGVNAAVGDAVKATKGALARNTAREAGRLTRTQGASEVDKLLEAWRLRQPLVGRGAGTIAPVSVSSLWDRIFD